MPPTQYCITTETPPPRRGLDPHPHHGGAEYHCPTCRAVNIVDADRVGKVVRCRHCRCAGIVPRKQDGDGTDVMPALDLYRAQG